MSQAAIDTEAFAEMKQLMGETFKDVIALCLQTLPAQLNDIEAAITGQNAKILFDVSHRMKSSCGSIGAFGLAEKAEAIELISRNGSAQIPSQIFNELADATRQVICQLDAELKS